MRIVKVLLLDDIPWWLPDLIPHGIKLEVIQEMDIGGGNTYFTSVKVCEVVKKLTANKEVDIVVVGNNLGAGVPKAKAIADDMKEMTVVVWNFYRKGDEAPYAAFGLKRFGSRSDLKQMIPAILGIVV